MHEKLYLISEESMYELPKPRRENLKSSVFLRHVFLGLTWNQLLFQREGMHLLSRLESHGHPCGAQVRKNGETGRESQLALEWESFPRKINWSHTKNMEWMLARQKQPCPLHSVMVAAEALAQMRCVSKELLPSGMNRKDSSPRF